MAAGDKVNFDAGYIPALQTLGVILISIALLSIILNAGWYNMFYKATNNPVNPNLTKVEQTVKSFELFKEFFPGVALYFYPFLLGSLIYFALIAILYLITYSIGIDHIGIPSGVSWAKFIDPEQTYNSLQEYIENLSPGIKYQIALWELLIMATIFIQFIVNYLTMFWAQLILINSVNPVKAFIDSFKTVFKHPLRSFIICLSYSFMLQVCFLVFSIPFILFQLLGIVSYIYTITFFNLMIFVYLGKKEENNNCSRGADCFR
ncbi:MAG: hypothetical protein AB1706_10320 [Pseudomonadota bacterium]